MTVKECDLALPMVVLLSYLRRHWGQRGHCNGVVEEIVKGGLATTRTRDPGLLKGEDCNAFCKERDMGRMSKYE